MKETIFPDSTLIRRFTLQGAVSQGLSAYVTGQLQMRRLVALRRNLIE